jgi:hypothetical protein
VAKLVGVFNTAHSPFCYLAAEQWEQVRSIRPPYRSDVPVDDAAVNVKKAARVQAGFTAVREQLEVARPDVLVVYGDDQVEMFDFNNFPSLAVYLGESFEGYRPEVSAREELGDEDKSTSPMQSVPGHPELATHLLTGLLASGFDPAFMKANPKPDKGMCHAIMNPLTSLTDFSIPTVPVLLNAYYAPQITALRCYEVGKTIRQLIEEFPADIRVAVIGSGGLWHTPACTESYIDEAFDRQCLEYLAQGDIKAMASHFDAYRAATDDASQENSGCGTTGLPTPGGPQGGTRETCGWIAAAAMTEGNPTVIVDYVPIYASPIGVSFSYCLEP